MPTIISGTTGISTPDGSASVPPYTGSSGATNGLFFPSATTVAFAANGTEWARIPATGGIQINSSGGGSMLLSPASTASAYTYTLPADTGTVLLSSTAVNQSTTGPTITKYTSGSGTYTLPANVKWIRVIVVGGGGGGGPSGTSAGPGSAGTSGGDTTFGSSLLTASGGAYGAVGGGAQAGGAGGGFTLSSPAIGFGSYGGAGEGGKYQNSSTNDFSGGTGGCSAIGGGARGGNTNAAGLSASANTGGGGGGSGLGAIGGSQCGTGGGGGGYISAIITSPSATYSYAVGAGGNGGGAGTSGYAGGAGGSGIIIIEEHYNY